MHSGIPMQLVHFLHPPDYRLLKETPRSSPRVIDNMSLFRNIVLCVIDFRKQGERYAIAHPSFSGDKWMLIKYAAGDVCPTVL